MTTLSSDRVRFQADAHAARSGAFKAKAAAKLRANEEERSNFKAAMTANDNMTRRMLRDRDRHNAESKAGQSAGLSDMTAGLLNMQEEATEASNHDGMVLDSYRRLPKRDVSFAPDLGKALAPFAPDLGKALAPRPTPALTAGGSGLKDPEPTLLMIDDILSTITTTRTAEREKRDLHRIGRRQIEEAKEKEHRAKPGYGRRARPWESKEKKRGLGDEREEIDAMHKEIARMTDDEHRDEHLHREELRRLAERKAREAKAQRLSEMDAVREEGRRGFTYGSDGNVRFRGGVAGADEAKDLIPNQERPWGKESKGNESPPSRGKSNAAAVSFAGADGGGSPGSRAIAAAREKERREFEQREVQAQSTSMGRTAMDSVVERAAAAEATPAAVVETQEYIRVHKADKNVIMEHSDMNTTADGGAVSFEHKKNDVLAVDAFRDFEAEIHSWKWKGGLSEPPHRLGAFADYLSERYMCQRLDPLRGSAVVTSIRKRVTRRIEDISNGRDPEEEAERERGEVPQPPAPANGLDAQAVAAEEARLARARWQRPMPKKSADTRGTADDGYARPFKCGLCGKQNGREAEKCVTCGRARGFGEKPKKEKKHWCEAADAVGGGSAGGSGGGGEVGDSANMSNDRLVDALHGKWSEGEAKTEEEEKEEKEKREKIAAEYKQFVQTKLRLDRKGDDHSRFADEIKDVLGSLQFSPDSQLVGQPVPSTNTNPFLAKKE